jgi:lysophospholipase L1-like esterase
MSKPIESLASGAGADAIAFREAVRVIVMDIIDDHFASASAGAASAGKVAVLDGLGRLHPTLLAPDGYQRANRVVVSLGADLGNLGNFSGTTLDSAVQIHAGPVTTDAQRCGTQLLVWGNHSKGSIDYVGKSRGAAVGEFSSCLTGDTIYRKFVQASGTGGSFGHVGIEGWVVDATPTNGGEVAGRYYITTDTGLHISEADPARPDYYGLKQALVINRKQQVCLPGILSIPSAAGTSFGGILHIGKCGPNAGEANLFFDLTGAVLATVPVAGTFEVDALGRYWATNVAAQRRRLLTTADQRGRHALPQRLLNRRVMASPPTVTYNAANPMGSSRFVQAADGTVVTSYFNYRKGTVPIAANALVYDKGASVGLIAGVASNTSHTAGVGVVYDGATFCWNIQNNGQKIWIKVDGEYVSMTPTTLSTDQAIGWLEIAFGSAKMREIELIVAGVGSQLRLSGATIEEAATMAPVAGRGPKIFVLGDSIVETTGPTLGINAYPVVLGDALGCDNVTASAIGGTGLLATAGGTKLTYRGRVLTDVIAYKPDIVIISGSPNDSTRTTAEVSAELQLLIADIRAELPDCKVIATSMMLGAGTGFNAPSIYLAAEGLEQGAEAAGVPFINLLEQDIPAASVTTGALSRAAAANDTRLYTVTKQAKGTTIKFANGTRARVVLGTASGTGDFICDVDKCYGALPSGSTFTVCGNSIWSGNGRVGATNGSGNCDRVVSADGIHPSDDGAIMIGTGIAYGLAQVLSE